MKSQSSQKNLITLISFLFLTSCSSTSSIQREFFSIEESLSVLGTYDLPEETISILEMKKPENGKAKCKSTCALEHANNVNDCHDYCDCAYEGSSVADIIGGSPSSWWGELICRVEAARAGIKID